MIDHTPNADIPSSGWFREHTSTLRGFDADAPLDDLEPLRDIVGDAQERTGLPSSSLVPPDQPEYLAGLVRDLTREHA